MTTPRTPDTQMTPNSSHDDALHTELQAWLDQWANCFLLNDHQTFFDMLSIPFSVRSHGSEWMVSTFEQSKAGFDVYRASIDDAGVELIVRVLRGVDHLSETEVKVIYENYLMKGSQRVFRPSGAEAYLRRDGTSWKATRVIEVHYDDAGQSSLPDIRPDLMHDKVLRDRLTALKSLQQGRQGDEND